VVANIAKPKPSQAFATPALTAIDCALMAAYKGWQFHERNLIQQALSSTLWQYVLFTEAQPKKTAVFCNAGSCG